MTEVETHKARKAHRCEWCWQRIDEGTEYKRYRYYDGGDAATIKMHPECMEAMQEEAAYWGGYFEWTPGQERPKVGADETANARLIAAAPDLLRALASLADLASCVEQPEDAAIAEEFDRAYRNAAQAIARATLPFGGAAYECRADHKGRA